jgi:molybdopterin-guanine dinucleotide biosynthesis protein A
MSENARAGITGLILAGGLGRRMGGVDKGLQLMAGKALVMRVMERLTPQVDTLLINANRNLDAYAALGCPIVSDRIEGFAGPLVGIHAGLTVCTTPLLVTAPCDVPFLPSDLVARLYDALSHDGTDIALPRTGDGLQPAFTLMRRDVLSNLTDYLAAGHRRIQDWCRQLPLSVVDFSDGDSFANINTPADLERLARP